MRRLLAADTWRGQALLANMNIEAPLQFDLFSGELVDNRSDYQRRLDREREKPQQMLMFKTPEIVQFGGQSHSAYREWLDEATPPSLSLEREDVRTDEERERDLMRDAEQRTRPLFAAPPDTPPTEVIGENPLISTEPVEYRIALFHLGKAELIDSRADLKDQIEQLKETDIEAIALEAEEALRAVYVMVLNITLTNYLTRETPPIALS